MVGTFKTQAWITFFFPLQMVKILPSMKFLSPYNPQEFSDVNVSSTKIDLAERQRSSTSGDGSEPNMRAVRCIKKYIRLE